MTEYKIETTVDINELWEAVWGSDGIGMDWCSAVRTIDKKGIKLWTDDFEPNPQDFRVYDQYEEKWIDITLEQLVKGYQQALQEKATHCGDYLVANLDDPDACTGDILLQYAAFGELIYG
jgi:hypothetical protein